VFPWISLSIHPGGVRWIIIFGKDFDRPRWIKRFLRIYNYVEELLWFRNQKFLLLIQVCFYDSQCATTNHPSLRVPLPGTKGNLTPGYLVSSYFCQAWNHCLPKLKLLQFRPSPLMCFMFVISRVVYKHSFYELTMRYSIFLKIHPSRVIPSFL
jgi:hypothetical protein